MKYQLVSATFLSVFLVACGSGSGKSSTPAPNPAPSSSSIASSVSSLSSLSSSIAVSSESSSVGLAQPITGIFVDAAVANLGYKTPTLNGKTNINGEFNCRPDELITFFIGQMEFPPVPCKDIITPLDLADTDDKNHPVVINIARLLQTLDTDGDLSNGISLSDDILDVATHLDFTLDPEVFAQLPEVAVLLQKAGKQALVSVESALAHLQETLDFIHGESSSSASSVASSTSSTNVESSTSSVASQGGVSSVSSAPVSSASSSVAPVADVKTWGFNANAYASFLGAVNNGNFPVTTNDDPRSVDGLLIFLRSGTALRFREDGRWNFNGASWASSADTVVAPAVGQQAPDLRAWLGIPVDARAFNLEIHWQQSNSSGVDKGKVLLVGSNNVILAAYDVLSGTGTIQYSASASHGLTHVRIAYSRENLSPATGGVHIGDVTRTQTGNLPGSSSSSSTGNTSSAGNHSTGGQSSSSSVGGGSSVSSAVSSTGSQSSQAGNPGAVRPAKIEGFAAYANVTGGAGGPVYIVTTGTELNQALCGPRNGNRTAPVTILVNGTINHGNTTSQGCDTQSNVIEIKNTSNVSIIGVGTNALFDQIGIHVRDASNIIIQNVHIRNVKKSGTPTSNGGDAIGMETRVDRVWIDHNWLEASGGEKDGYDSLLDMKAGVTNVTVSYNLFNDSSRAGLIGSSDSDNRNNNITFHHNWYKNIEQRTPLIRHSLVHIYNNYWSNENRAAMIHGINSRMHASALVESNYFYNTNNPLLASTDSPQAGCWQTNNDNTLVNHIYTRTNTSNGARVIPEIINGQMQSTCSVSVPYTVDMDASANVPTIVMANAGVGKITVDTTGAIPVSGGSSSSAGSSSSGANSSASSSSSGVIEITDLPLSEGFNNVVNANDFFGAAYKSLASSYAPFYYRGGGTATFSDNQLTLTGGRFTLGNTRPATSTSSSDTQTYGELDLTQAYRISFCVRAASGSGGLQVFVNNNGTSAGNSIHSSSSRLFNTSAASLIPGQRVVVNSDVGNGNSFIQIRTESSATVVIDDLWIGYQDDTDSEPESESCTAL